MPDLASIHSAAWTVKHSSIGSNLKIFHDLQNFRTMLILYFCIINDIEIYKKTQYNLYLLRIRIENTYITIVTIRKGRDWAHK